MENNINIEKINNLEAFFVRFFTRNETTCIDSILIVEGFTHYNYAFEKRLNKLLDLIFQKGYLDFTSFENFQQNVETLSSDCFSNFDEKTSHNAITKDPIPEIDMISGCWFFSIGKENRKVPLATSLENETEKLDQECTNLLEIQAFLEGKDSEITNKDQLNKVFTSAQKFLNSNFLFLGEACYLRKALKEQFFLFVGFQSFLPYFLQLIVEYDSVLYLYVENFIFYLSVYKQTDLKYGSNTF